jgi:hypothetical protein
VNTPLEHAKYVKHPNLDRIFKDLYRVRVPMVDTLSDYDLKNRGLPSSGDEKIDKAMYQEPTVVYRTIDQIFEMYRAGVTISVVDYSDTRLMFDAVELHIQAWLNFLKNGVYLHQVPFDDLLDLDAFASTLHENAKHVIDRKSIKDIATNWNGLGIDLSRGAFMGSRGGQRFFHLLQSENDRRYEQGSKNPALLKYEGYGEELMRLADRFDRRPQESTTNKLRFGNDRPW